MQFFLAILAYVVPLFPLAYLWHLSTFKSAYDRLEIFRDKPIIPFGLFSMILQGIFFAWVFPKLFSGSNWTLNGLSLQVFSEFWVGPAWSFRSLRNTA